MDIRPSFLGARRLMSALPLLAAHYSAPGSWYDVYPRRRLVVPSSKILPVKQSCFVPLMDDLFSWSRLDWAMTPSPLAPVELIVSWMMPPAFPLLVLLYPNTQSCWSMNIGHNSLVASFFAWLTAAARCWWYRRAGGDLNGHMGKGGEDRDDSALVTEPDVPSDASHDNAEHNALEENGQTQAPDQLDNGSSQSEDKVQDDDTAATVDTKEEPDMTAVLGVKVGRQAESKARVVNYEEWPLLGVLLLFVWTTLLASMLVLRSMTAPKLYAQ